MDWSLNIPWELGELDPNAESINMRSMVGPSSGRLDCSVDLRLGGFGDFGLSEKWKEQQRVSMPSSSSKRARAPNNGNQNVSCSVDGCKADLSNCKRDYHRRHKVCEVHSKTPIVMVAGQEQRFCQQCSRFHLLVEFDEEKRSCRKRLDGHNRRRRKPQPESINSGSLFSDHQGNRFSSYSHLFPTSAANPNWPIMVKTEEDTLYPNHPPLHILNPQHHHFADRGSKHFPFLQESSSGSNSSKIFSNGLAHVLNSDCALSLLSSPQLGQIVTDRIPMGQPLLSYGGGLELGHQAAAAASNHVLRSGFSCSGTEDERVGTTVLVSDTSDHDMNCQGLFGSDEGGSQALHFW